MLALKQQIEDRISASAAIVSKFATQTDIFANVVYSSTRAKDSTVWGM